MKSDIKQNSVIFHNRAREIFYTLYRDFEHAVAPVNRESHENIFLQWLGRYTHELKHQLQQVAREVLEQMDPDTTRNELDHFLNISIDDYVKEFIQKARAL